jgi:hypothetical protein
VRNQYNRRIKRARKKYNRKLKRVRNKYNRKLKRVPNKYNRKLKRVPNIYYRKLKRVRIRNKFYLKFKKLNFYSKFRKFYSKFKLRYKRQVQTKYRLKSDVRYHKHFSANTDNKREGELQEKLFYYDNIFKTYYRKLI